MCRCSTRGRDGMRQWPSGCFVFDVTACGMKGWTRMSPKPYCCMSVCAIELALRNAVYEHARFAEVQNSGCLTAYFEKAKEVCAQNDVKVCDLHAVWKKLYDNGVNTTELLANKLNHPIREIHYYMAIKLLEIMFED